MKVTVVTGTAGGGVDTPPTGGRDPRPMPFVCVAVAVTVSVTGATDGIRVIEVGMPVQIPGFCGTKSAQIPAR